MGTARGSVLLLDGASLASLAFTRSLGRAGVRVTVAESAARALAGLSRYCSGYRECPSPLADPLEFQRWLLQEVQGGAYDVVTGTTDYTLPLLQEWKDLLLPHAFVPTVEPRAFETVYDKGATVCAAQQAGISTPPTHFLRSHADVESLPRGLWPLVIKPLRSVVVAGARRVPTQVQYAFNEESLRRLAQPQEDGSWPLVQEYVEGTGVGCFLLMHEGQVVLRFQHQRIRDKKPTGSGSCFRVSTAPDPQLMDASERLLRAVGWNGMAMVEFRVGADGTAYLMEVNGRPWGSMHLAMASGADFPLVWWRAATGEKVTPQLDYEIGIEGRYLAGDLQHLESVLLGPPRGWNREFPRRLPTMLAFLRFWGGKLHYDDFAANDRRPGWFGLRQYFRGLWNRVVRRVWRARKAQPS